jgi:hypothetical protein
LETTEEVVARTKKWILDVVVGANFCPFAAREMRLDHVHWEVASSLSGDTCLQAVLPECVRLEQDRSIVTTFLIFPHSLEVLDDYLEVAEQAERLMKRHGYAGVYQLASFHPLYCFASSAADDPANYTNRSIYPMLHLLREESITEALRNYPDPEEIWERNVSFAREKGLAYMQRLRDGNNPAQNL